MIGRRNRNGVATAIVVLLIALVAGASGLGGYYFSASASAKPNQSNPNVVTVTSSVTVTSTLLSTVTVTQGQTSANDAALNMTYSSSCISVDNSCSGSGYVIVFKNTGSSVVAGGTLQIYFGNGTSIYGQTSCAFTSTILPQYTFSCKGSTPSKVPAHSNVLLSITYPNGKSYSYTYVALTGIVLTSATLYASGNFQFALDNPGSQTNILSVKMVAGSGQSLTLTDANFFTINGVSGVTTIAGAQTNTVVLNLSGTTLKLVSGQTYAYIITFTNGQSITGSMIAQ